MLAHFQKQAIINVEITKKGAAMQSLTINIQNESLVEKVLWLLDHFKNDGLEIVSKEDIEDLKLLSATK